MKLHESEELPDSDISGWRMAVEGGWLYVLDTTKSPMNYPAAPPVFVADPTAVHCRQRVRKFRYQVREGLRSMDANGKVCIIWEADKTCAEFATIAEAHDALGPDSPWVEVTP